MRASSGRSTGRAGPARRPRPAGDTVRRGTPTNARAYRPPGARKRTWSAEHVPWWGEFSASADPATDARKRRRGTPRTDDGAAAGSPARDARSMDFDVFDRSSGAAWSAAARKHFRRGTDDLPSGGVWRYRGTQVVTGAEARRVAEEEEKEERKPR
jgi:hypothetical protein